MDHLFSSQFNKIIEDNAPLAVKMRPMSLDEYVGQEAVVGKDSWLYKAIRQDELSSIILYGPAGTGKTTLARIIAQTSNSEFVEVNAISSSVKDLRDAIKAARERLLSQNVKTILFVDEIHRFSRSQQDALLHAVENRLVILVGATTENPYFEVNAALNSRCRIIELQSLSNEDIITILKRALSDERGLQNKFKLDETALGAIAARSGGDARSALNVLELASQSAALKDKDADGQFKIELDDIKAASPRTGLSYDKTGDQHYDTISAFIKSMRGSDPDAALYYLARMIDSGEDPKFIARRIFIFASEDIGNADPQALCVASACFKACEVIGLPECQLNLAQAAVYMALAPKSNASYLAFNKALKDVRSGKRREIPSYLRDRHRPGSDEYGTYLYPHNYPGNYVEQRYLPEGLNKGDFFHPSEHGWEAYRSDMRQRDFHPEGFDKPFYPSEDI
ncbi:MAG: replication-associated recombination protein A [Coriobacteriia bacterium]|nr:replication-associated recombination protein A [Coriobacteriia bacterium]